MSRLGKFLVFRIRSCTCFAFTLNRRNISTIKIIFVYFMSECLVHGFSRTSRLPPLNIQKIKSIDTNVDINFPDFLKN